MEKLRMLVVEDDKGMADLIRRVGMEVGFDAQVATTQREFIALFPTFNPEILVLDIIMPEMDGMEVLKFLSKSNKNVRIVISSGQDAYRQMAGHLGEGLGLNICATIQKPFRIEELRRLFSKVMQSASRADDFLDRGLFPQEKQQQQY